MLPFSILTAGADKMAQTDPHGWTLSIVAVLVVFCALLVLFLLFNTLGGVFRRADERLDARRAAYNASAQNGKPEDAAAPDAEIAAIATALHLYYTDCIHDREPGIVTIRPAASPWGDKSLNFRKKPGK